MSDELTFLRWVYHNAGRFILAGDQTLAFVTNELDRAEMLETYVRETGNPVPGDYKE